MEGDNRRPGSAHGQEAHTDPESNEIYKVIHGLPSEKRIVPVDTEEEERRQRRMEQDLRITREERKVMHRHNRSSSRARDSS